MIKASSIGCGGRSLRIYDSDRSFLHIRTDPKLGVGFDTPSGFEQAKEFLWIVGKLCYRAKHHILHSWTDDPIQMSLLREAFNHAQGRPTTSYCFYCGIGL